MFNFRYNLLVLTQTLINFINAFFLIKVFGVNEQTDAYFLSLAIFEMIVLVQATVNEQFIIFYNDIKSRCEIDAKNFYNSAFNLSILFGLIGIILMFLFKPFIIKISAYGIDIQRYEYLSQFVGLLFLNTLIFPLFSLNEKFFNSEMKFSIPYIFNIFPAFFVFCSLLYCYFASRQELIILVYARVFAMYLSVLIGSYIIFKNMVIYKPICTHKKISAFISNSFKMKIGSNIYNILNPLIVNNILSFFSAGFISYYHYAFKIVNIINLLASGPSAKILQARLSSLWPENKFYEIKAINKKFIQVTIPVFVGAFIISFFIIPYFMDFVAGDKLILSDIKYIQYLFLAMFPLYLVKLIEVPFVLTIFTSKKSLYIITTNIVYVIVFFAITFFLKDIIGVYAIPIGAFIAQLINIITYLIVSNKLIDNMRNRVFEYENSFS